MSTGQTTKEKEPESTGFFSGFLRFLSSFTFKLNPTTEKKVKELSCPNRADWRKAASDIWLRSFDQLPLDVDLPRLAARVSLEDHRTCDASLLLPTDPNEKEEDPAQQKPERSVSINLRPQPVGPGANSDAMNAASAVAARRSYLAVCELLYEIMFLLGGPEKAEEIKKKYMEDLPEDCDIAVQRSAFKTFLSEAFGNDSPAGRCLKSINQAITAPGNKEALINLLPGVFFKDSQQRPWEVVVRVFDDHTEVSHQRGQCNLQNKPDAAFSFVLETTFVFDKNLENMTDGHLYVDEYSFAPTTSEACKSQMSKLFDAHLRPVQSSSTPPARVVSNVGRRVTNYMACHPAPEAKKEEASEQNKDDASEPKKEESSEPKKEESSEAKEEVTSSTAATTEEKTEAPTQ